MDDSHVEWFEGNFADYEEDKKRRLGDAPSSRTASSSSASSGGEHGIARRRQSRLIAARSLMLKVPIATVDPVMALFGCGVV